MAGRILSVARQLSKTPSQFNATHRSLITGPEWLNKCKKIQVLDSHMTYYDSGLETNSHEAVIFLHGNPTSSYLWRNIVPHVTSQARCLAPDLVGMGGSGASGTGTYRFIDHYTYLSEWLKLVDLPERVVLVGHDWGSVLAFHWCHLNIARVKGIVHMESIVASIKSWEQWPEIARQFFQALRTEAGEDMVLKKNLFVRRLLPASIKRELRPEEMDAYIQPFAKAGESRRPTLTWPREIPLLTEGPADVVEIVEGYREFLRSTPGLPKLFIKSDPGFFTPMIKEEASKWPDTFIAKVKGLHFLQEDSPDEIGLDINLFVKKLNKLA